MIKSKINFHTFKKRSSKVDAQIPIPASLTLPLDKTGYILRLKFLEMIENTVLRPETNDDPGNTKQKRLYPEFLQLALVLEHVFVVFDAGGGLELDPVYGVIFIFRLLAKDYEGLLGGLRR